MEVKPYLLSIDQGTTSSRAIVFNHSGDIISSAQKELPQHFPHDAWVEHDPEDIWRDTISSCRDALFKNSIHASSIAAIGITNQRETTVVWERKSGKVIYNAIVWQDRRTAELCKKMKANGYESMLQEKTGLLLDPYFSATKIHWILENVAGARDMAERGELAFGTIDCFLLWRLTGGKVHATDATNASRTAVFNIHTQQWDEELLHLFNIPASMLPEVRDSSDDYGMTLPELLGESIPICGIAGDQQAATFGQACFKPGMVKSTYGTGAFMLLNTGEEAVKSNNRLLTTTAYRLKGKVCYGLEGSIFVAGAVMQWLRDQINFLHHASDSEKLASSVDGNNNVYFVPAFTGLGAPYWDANARGTITGLTRNSSIENIVRAALESVCYSTLDLLDAMHADGAHIGEMRIDGGMVNNDWLCQFLSDMLRVPVIRPKTIETTALGVAFLAGLQAGVFDSLEQISELWQSNQRFEPTMDNEKRTQLYAGWKKAIRQTLVE